MSEPTAIPAKEEAVKNTVPRTHVLSAQCWCKPVIEHIPPSEKGGQ